MTTPSSIEFHADSFIKEREFEPQRQNSGFLYVPLIDGIVINDPKVLALAIDTLRLPSYGTEDIQVGYFNEFVSFAGKSVFDDIDMTIKDFVDGDGMLAIDKWFNQVYSPGNGEMEMAYTIKKDAYAVIYDTAGENMRYYLLKGCFPSHIARGDLDQNTSDYVRITVTFSVDRVVPWFMEGKLGSGAAKYLPGGTSPLNLTDAVSKLTK